MMAKTPKKPVKEKPVVPVRCESKSERIKAVDGRGKCCLEVELRPGDVFVPAKGLRVVREGDGGFDEISVQEEV